jgi:hypothetical protein
MASAGRVVRKNVMLEAPKVKLLVKKLGARSESEAIRTVIDDFLFADEVMKRVRGLRRRGTLRDAYRRSEKRGTRD